VNPTHSTIPVIAVAETPRAGREAERFARGIRAYADILRAHGVLIVSSHWDRSNDSPSAIIEVNDRGEAPPQSFSLAERAAALLKNAGLSTEFGRSWPRENEVWSAIVEAHADAEFPVVHVSVPARFGSDLIVLAARALEPLRREAVLLVGLSSAFGQAIRAETSRDSHPSLGMSPSTIVEGAPV
jgi:aromatic ring-opening dioxygenase catalytic subunit (LigB family)